jgi:hypothetical protein
MPTLTPQQVIGRRLQAIVTTNIRSKPDPNASILRVAKINDIIGTVSKFIPTKGKQGYFEVTKYFNDGTKQTGYVSNALQFKAIKINNNSWESNVIDFVTKGVTNPAATATGGGAIMVPTGEVLQDVGQGIINVASWTKWLLIGGAGLLIYKMVNSANVHYK